MHLGVRARVLLSLLSPPRSLPRGVVAPLMPPPPPSPLSSPSSPSPPPFLHFPSSTSSFPSGRFFFPTKVAGRERRAPRNHHGPCEFPHPHPYFPRGGPRSPRGSQVAALVSAGVAAASVAATAAAAAIAIIVTIATTVLAISVIHIPISLGEVLVPHEDRKSGKARAAESPSGSPGASHHFPSPRESLWSPRCLPTARGYPQR